MQAPASTSGATEPATSTALLPALSLRIVRLLENALVVGVGHTPSVRLTQPRELAYGSAEGLTLTLVGVHTLATGRNAPPRADPTGTAAAPLVVEAHYLLTAWANQAALQQWMLAAALRQLHQHPVIAAAELTHPYSAGADLGVDAGSTCRLTITNLSLEQATALSTALAAPALPPSLYVTAGPIEIR